MWNQNQPSPAAVGGLALAATPPKGHGERILFIDDEPALVAVTRLILQRQGYQVSAYESPLAAWADFQRDPGSYDLVITDMAMEEMSGVEFARRVWSVRAGLPIILATGYGTLLHPETSAMGFSEIIAKPAPPRHVTNVIGRIFQARVSPPHSPHHSP